MVQEEQASHSVGIQSHTLRAQGKIVLCVASSGIAALILRGGRTAHSTFRIPIDVHEDTVCEIPKKLQEGQTASEDISYHLG